MFSCKCHHPFLREFTILFWTVKLKLGHTFSQFIHRFKIRILKCWSWAVYILLSFTQFITAMENWDFRKPALHFQIFPNSLKSLTIEMFTPLLSYFVKWWGWSFWYDSCDLRVEQPIYNKITTFQKNSWYYNEENNFVSV